MSNGLGSNDKRSTDLQTVKMEYGCDLNIQYVELGGVVGVFVRLDAALIDEHSLDTLLHSTQQQVQTSIYLSICLSIFL